MTAKELDEAAVDYLAAAMKRQLAIKRAKGKGGWETCSRVGLMDEAKEHLRYDKIVDAANFIAFLFARDAAMPELVQYTEATRG